MFINGRTHWILGWVVFAGTAAASQPAWSEPSSTPSEIQLLRQEIKTLREHSALLEQRLNALTVKQQNIEAQTQATGRQKATQIESIQHTAQSAPPKAAPEAPSDNDQKSLKEKVEAINLHGAALFGYSYRPHKGKSHRDRLGSAGGSQFRVGFDSQVNDILFDVQYRFYSFGDMFHHATMGYRFDPTWRLDGGVVQVPFGKLPYASRDYWWGLPFFVGLEDDHDAGLVLSGDFEDWKLKLGFFKNEEYGSATRTARYGIDIIQSSTASQTNMENNQFNLHLTRDLQWGSDTKVELGGSAQWGQLYNESTLRNGHHWAGALHMSADRGPINLTLEGIRYEYHPENPASITNKSIMMGGMGGSYMVASEGWLGDINLSYTKPMEKWGPLKEITFYDHYSILKKDPDGWHDSHINALGMMFNAKPIYVYMDYTVGKNTIWIGDSGKEPS
ncbi:MAG: hypothetical protein HQL53_09830, partial [Magnetococcales bacterium]|nr:hypothetical protein [Magnetococcales bacterium]